VFSGHPPLHGARGAELGGEVARGHSVRGCCCLRGASGFLGRAPLHGARGAELGGEVARGHSVRGCCCLRGASGF